ncbi:MAG TPA: adenylate/guanylate cyclase domain-containing protein [Burkholderiales bacterium]|nr:adenylate/guanylate cyclase domain-containing protein [Burkholderiales bacterium]
MSLNIRAWLEASGFGQYADSFEANKIDGEALLALTHEHLKELGIPLSRRAQLLEAIARLSPGSSPSPAAGPGRSPGVRTAGTAPDATVTAERRHLTVMFVDLVGSTALSNRLDPEDLSKVIRKYQDAVVGEVTRYDGHVAQYLGDGVLAYFCFPMAHEDDAERCVRAALATLGAVAAMGSLGVEDLAVRIGIATGIVVAGDLLGEGAAWEHAIVGETPNLAARLQGVAASGEVVVSASTRHLVGHLFEVRDLGPQYLKGFAAPVAAYAITGERSSESRFEARRGEPLAAMVGRDNELTVLIESWRRVESGEGQLTIITGDAGIGKSRIIRALQDALAADLPARINYQCSPHHSDSALFPVLQHLARVARFEPADTPDRKLDRLEALLNEFGVRSAHDAGLIAALLGIDGAQRYGPLKLTPPQQRLGTFKALTGLLVDVARTRPLLWTIEDVHWIDPTTLELIDLCLERIENLPVLILVSARPTFHHAFGDRPNLTRLPLFRLGRPQIAAMVRGVTRGKSLPEELLNEIAIKSDGVPLFIEELTKTVLESGFLHETPDAFVVDDPLPNLAIPASLHDSLMARLDRLQPVKEVAQTAACIGREFSYRLLTAIMPRDKPPDHALARLVEAELIFSRNRPQEGQYAFKHALVRDAAYESLLKAKRQQIHERLVNALEASPDTPPEILAFHAMQAGLTEKAIAWWQKAGAQAIARPAYKEAIAHLSHALRLAEQMGETRVWLERRLLILLTLGQASIPLRGYGHAQTVAAFTRAQELVGAMSDAPHRFSVFYAVWVALYIRGEHDKALETAGSMMREAERDCSNSHMFTAVRSLAMSQVITGAPALAMESFERARALSGSLRRRSREERITLADRFATEPDIATGFHRGLTLWCLGGIDAARSVVAEALASARALGHVHTLCHALAYSSVIAAFDRSVDEALALSAETIDFASRHQLEMWKGYGSVINAHALSLNGDAEGSIRVMEEGFAWLARTQTGHSVPVHQAVHARTLASLGRFGEAGRYASMVRTELKSGSERYYWPECQRLLGDYLRVCPGSEPAEVEATYLSALSLAREQHAKTWEFYAAISVARLWAEQGKAGQAADLLGTSCDGFAEGRSLPAWKEAETLRERLRSRGRAT